MKKIEKLSLNRLSKKELFDRELNKIKGGVNLCGCGCCYGGLPGDPGWGGSSTLENATINCIYEYDSYDPERCPHGEAMQCF